MFRINENYVRLPGSYLFSDIARKVAAYTAAHPDRPIIRLGIGDVTRPLAPAVVAAMKQACDEMGDAATFRGYGPEQGYGFLREAIAEHDYRARGVDIAADEVFVSDGAKSDTGNIGDIFGADNVVAVCDPVYPVYVDTNAMAGRAGEVQADGRWSRLVYMPCTEANGFIPALPAVKPDMIYLCFPNNPTGAAITYDGLRQWVEYAREIGAVILYDSAYEAFITEDLPHSIFEIEGAKECAIEFRSFSKTAGFTGVRCAYTVIPHELSKLRAMWNRRQCTKFNGVSYVTQRAAEAIYSPVGWQQTKAVIAGYMKTAGVIRKELTDAGYTVFGGEHAPYIWWKIEGGEKSFDFFDRLLATCEVVGTPGSGFGPCGEGYFRMTAFGDYERTCEALKRIRERL